MIRATVSVLALALAGCLVPPGGDGLAPKADLAAPPPVTFTITDPDGVAFTNTDRAPNSYRFTGAGCAESSWLLLTGEQDGAGGGAWLALPDVPVPGATAIYGDEVPVLGWNWSAVLTGGAAAGWWGGGGTIDALTDDHFAYTLDGGDLCTDDGTLACAPSPGPVTIEVDGARVTDVPEIPAEGEPGWATDDGGAPLCGGAWPSAN
ncbi:MAG: hypothetical protein ABMB14_07945 [Myxococcota bacterium]